MMLSYIDMHCDSLLRALAQGEDSLYDGNGMQSMKKMVEAGQIGQFFAIFFPPHEELIKRMEQDGEGIKGEGFAAEERYFQRLREALYHQVSLHSDKVAMAHNYAQIRENRAAGKASAILTVEDGRLVNGEIEKLLELYRQGVRALTLTWNQENCFGCPNSGKGHLMKKGLTDFGKEAIGEMNRLGMVIDVSHLSDGGFWDVAALSEKPFIASHSNCRALTPHPRNLTDDMIALLAERGGVAGVNLCPEFVYATAGKGLYSPMQEAIGKCVDRGEGKSRVEDLAAHVLHFIQVGGEECVGIGTDFDGIEGTLEVDCPAKMELLFDALAKQGVTRRQLDKIASGNVLRVVKDSMK